MTQPLEDPRIPLQVRTALANAALAYANALVEGSDRGIRESGVELHRAAEDARICQQAAMLGMV